MHLIVGELVRYLLRTWVGEVELILGFPLAFAFWCVQYAITRWPVRRAESIVLAVAASGIMTLLLMPEWEPGTLFRIVLAGCLLYMPLFWLTRRRHPERHSSRPQL